MVHQEKNIKMFYPYENLKKIREEKKLSIRKMASLLNTSPSQVQYLENGERTLTLEWAQRLSQVLDCSPADILGYENLGIQPLTINESQSIEKIDKSKSITIPYYEQKVSAGGGVLGNNGTKYPLILDKKWLQQEFFIKDFSNLFAMIAYGDSMEPDIKSGDTLICKECSSLNEGVYIVAFMGELFVKKVQQFNKSKIKLISFNKHYKDRIINLKELQEHDFKIIAKVLANIRKFTN